VVFPGSGGRGRGFVLAKTEKGFLEDKETTPPGVIDEGVFLFFSG